MSKNPAVLYHYDTCWSFTCDATHAPEYVLFVLRGKADKARMYRMIDTLRQMEARLLLDTGHLCPIIIDRRLDKVPDPAVLQSWRALLEQVQPHLSCLITLVDPGRPDAALMAISLEILSQFLTPRCTTVTSWEQALEEARLFRASQVA